MSKFSTRLWLPAGILFSCLFLSACLNPDQADFINKPIPELPGSEIFRVTVNDRTVWTEKFLTKMLLDSLPDWFRSESYTNVQQEVHMADFSLSGAMQVKITVPHNIKQASIRPASREIEPVFSGNSLSFEIPGPDQLYIEIDSLPPLCFFANPEEDIVSETDSAGVYFFGPGVHRPGYITLKDNERVYIAGGAIVYGGIRADSVSHIRVYGRGILDGNFEYERMVLIRNSRDILFEGITIRNGRSWTNTLINCENVHYNQVKVISFGPGGDGINPLGSRHFRITNSFLRCTDDCIAIKNPYYDQVVKDILVSGNTMVGYAFSDGVTIGFETNGPSISGVRVENCDILLARGGSRVEGHSGFSIICDGPSRIENIYFENIRVEKSEIKLFELNITNGTLYGNDKPGQIDKVRLKNIHWMHEGPIVLKGFSHENRVTNVYFEDCYAGGIRLDSLKQKIMNVGAFVENVKIVNGR